MLNNHPYHCFNNSYWLLTGRIWRPALCFSVLCLFILFFSWTETLTGGMTLPKMYGVEHMTELGIGFLSTVAHTDITRQLCQQQPCNCRHAGHFKGLTASQEGLRIKSSWRKRNKKDKLANQETKKALLNYISMKGAFFFLIIHAFYLAHCS